MEQRIRAVEERRVKVFYLHFFLVAKFQLMDWVLYFSYSTAIISVVTYHTKDGEEQALAKKQM